MRLLIQRVTNASVLISGEIHAEISKGLLVLVGIEENDKENDAEWLAQKTSSMRIFSDKEGKMNLSIMDTAGEILLVSQFTLFASTKKGNRPSFIRAARPEKAVPLYEKFIDYLEKEVGKKIKTGVFGADMKIELTNDGPLTLMIDSKNKE